MPVPPPWAAPGASAAIGRKKGSLTLQVAAQAGLSLRVYCTQIGVADSTDRRTLAGDEAAFGPGVRSRVRRPAAVTRFEPGGTIDWGGPRAFFWLRMLLGLGVGAMARAVGCSDQQIAIWDRECY
jgi:hypothetical protein